MEEMTVERKRKVKKRGDDGKDSISNEYEEK